MEVQKVEENPFKFKQRSRRAEKSLKYYQRKAALNKKDKKKFQRILRLRKIHLARYISVKSRGKKWWEKELDPYYNEITEEELLSCQENTTNQTILKFQDINLCQVPTYKQSHIYNHYQQYFKDSLIRILFQKYQPKSNTTEFQLVFFKWFTTQPAKKDENESENSDEDCMIIERPVEFQKKERSSQQQMKSKQRQLKRNKLPIMKYRHIQRQLKNRELYEVEETGLQFVGSTKNVNLILQILTYEEQLKQSKYDEVDTQLELLQQQLTRTHDRNFNFWEKVIQSYREIKQRQQYLLQIESEIKPLQVSLACRNRLTYYQKGFIDKTEDQLEEALEELQLEETRVHVHHLSHSNKSKKRMLITFNDCKVCFFPIYKENNLLVTCSQCHTSYHQHCYAIPTDTIEESYICDGCLFLQKIDTVDLGKTPLCSICYSAPEFPVKDIQGRYYHVTCLYVYQLVQPNTYDFTFKQHIQIDSIQHQIIMNKSIKNIRCQYCRPLGHKSGLKMKCSQINCFVYFHPICAYLRGCSFKVTRNEIEIETEIRCSTHVYESQEDELRQVYLRRFFCNYKGMQRYNEEQYKIIYMKEKKEVALSIVQQKYSQYEDHMKDLQKNLSKVQITPKFKQSGLKKKKGKNKQVQRVQPQSMEITYLTEEGSTYDGIVQNELQNEITNNQFICCLCFFIRYFINLICRDKQLQAIDMI